MVFIDKAGNIYDIKVGSGNEAEITEKIKLLLAANNFPRLPADCRDSFRGFFA